MNQDHILIFAGLLIVLVLIIWIALKVIRWIFYGAGILLAFAAAQGFIGIAAYVALWVLAFPIMLIISALIGLFTFRYVNKFDRANKNPN